MYSSNLPCSAHVWWYVVALISLLWWLYLNQILKISKLLLYGIVARAIVRHYAIYEGKTGWLFIWWRLYNPVMLLKSFYHYKSRRVNDTNIVNMIYKKRLSTTPHPKTNPIVRYREKHKCRRFWQSCYSDVCNDMSCIKVTTQSYESNTAHDQTILLCTGDRNIVISHDSLNFQMNTICPNNLQPGQAVVESNGHVGQHIMITRYKNDISVIILKCVVE